MSIKKYHKLGELIHSATYDMILAACNENYCRNYNLSEEERNAWIDLAKGEELQNAIYNSLINILKCEHGIGLE
jgi:hypothetical protein